MKKLYASFAVLTIATASFCQSTGFLPPTATAAPNGFTNPANAFASDDVWASVSHGSGCRCPFLYVSWDGGTSYSSSQLLGPFGTTDQTAVAGSPTFTWGHAWTDVELSNTNFRLKIANPSTLIEQGYSDFNFNIPTNAAINGIEVQLEWHGDANFTMEFLDQALVNVYYTATTGSHQVQSITQNILIFPNPAHDHISIDLGELKSGDVYVLDLQGREVLHAAAGRVTSSGQLDLDVSTLPKGMYLVRVMNASAVINKKIVLE